MSGRLPDRRRIRTRSGRCARAVRSVVRTADSGVFWLSAEARSPTRPRAAHFLRKREKRRPGAAFRGARPAAGRPVRLPGRHGQVPAFAEHGAGRSGTPSVRTGPSPGDRNRCFGWPRAAWHGLEAPGAAVATGRIRPTPTRAPTFGYAASARTKSRRPVRAQSGAPGGPRRCARGRVWRRTGPAAEPALPAMRMRRKTTPRRRPDWHSHPAPRAMPLATAAARFSARRASREGADASVARRVCGPLESDSVTGFGPNPAQATGCTPWGQASGSDRKCLVVVGIYGI